MRVYQSERFLTYLHQATSYKEQKMLIHDIKAAKKKISQAVYANHLTSCPFIKTVSSSANARTHTRSQKPWRLNERLSSKHCHSQRSDVVWGINDGASFVWQGNCLRGILCKGELTRGHQSVANSMCHLSLLIRSTQSMAVSLDLLKWEDAEATLTPGLVLLSCRT